jgi:transitional endoplasmic reticulum ATPase
MDIKFSLYFGRADSADFNQALELASAFDGFVPAGSDADLFIVETTNQEALAKFSLFTQLLTTLSRITPAEVRFRDTDWQPDPFLNGIKAVAVCCQQYLHAADKADYCDNGEPDCWGCRLLNGIILHHDAEPFDEAARYWYQFGSYLNATTWKINKEDIYKELMSIVENRFIDFCPVFQLSFFRRLLAALPATLDLADSKSWGQVFLDEVATDHKKWTPVNVHHKTAHAAGFKKAKQTKSEEQLAAEREEHRAKVEANQYLRYIPETSFDDVGGIEDIIQSIRETIELPIRQPDLYAYMGIKPHRGILLWGDPGNGKTLVAKAIAHEVKAHFIPIAGPDVLNKSFGESEKNLRDIFEQARELQPTIIFIDEIDAIAQARLAGETSKWYATVVNQLLSLMDGINVFGNVTVLASTNRPDLLDPALLRPGRFDYKLEIKKPNLHGCKQILDIVTRGMPLADDVDLFTFAEAIIGFSAADIAFIAREAALVALRRNMDIKAVVLGETAFTDYSKLIVTRTDFYSALVTLKKLNKYTNKTYSLKG